MKYFKDSNNKIITDTSGNSLVEGLHGYKQWTVTLPSQVSSGDVILASGDADIAEHYADSTAFAVCLFTGDLTNLQYYEIAFMATANFTFGFGGNISETKTPYYSCYSYESSAAMENSVATDGYPLNGTKSAFKLTAGSDGNLLAYATGSRMYPAGTYSVSFYW